MFVFCRGVQRHLPTAVFVEDVDRLIASTV